MNLKVTGVTGVTRKFNITRNAHAGAGAGAHAPMRTCYADHQKSRHHRHHRHQAAQRQHRGSKCEPAAWQAKSDGSECKAVTSSKIKSSPMHETCTKVLKNFGSLLTGAHWCLVGESDLHHVGTEADPLDLWLAMDLAVAFPIRLDHLKLTCVN